jgi:hypothetical protein
VPGRPRQVRPGVGLRFRAVSRALAFRRWGVVVAAALAGLLAFVSMLVDPAPNADGRELLEAYSENPGAQGLHTNLLHYGFALFAPVAYAMVALVRERGAWLANLAGVLAVLGLSTLPGLVMIDFLGVATVRVADVETAFQAGEELENLPGFVALVVPAFLTSLLAVPVATIAMWRARLFPWWVPVIVAAAFLLVEPLPDNVLAFAIVALAFLVLAYALWRVPVAAWQGRPTPAPPSEAVPEEE